jgi:hypothetical protein
MRTASLCLVIEVFIGVLAGRVGPHGCDCRVLHLTVFAGRLHVPAANVDDNAGRRVRVHRQRAVWRCGPQKPGTR